MKYLYIQTIIKCILVNCLGAGLHLCTTLHGSILIPTGTVRGSPNGAAPAWNSIYGCKLVVSSLSLSFFLKVFLLLYNKLNILGELHGTKICLGVPSITRILFAYHCLLSFRYKMKLNHV